MAYIRNSYSWIKLVCGNHGDNNDIEMSIKIGPSSPFYACPKYYEENRTEHERMCVNRISEVDYERILSHITNIIIKARDNDETIDLTNYEWNKNGVFCKVLEHTDENIIVRVLNKKALAR